MRRTFSTLLFLALAPLGKAAPVVDYRRDIQPILSEYCFHCHGQDDGTRKSGLRLDLRDAALKGGKNDGAAIVPGKPEKSALVSRISTTEKDDVMPPADKNHPLKPEEVEKLRQWVSEGAPYATHWAFTAPQKAPVPVIAEEKDRKLTPIDAFIAARLQKEGLAMSAPAAPEILCRRVYLDLIGLPPSPAEVEAFVKQSEAERSETDSTKVLPEGRAGGRVNPKSAIEQLVDRLLADRRFGEKWARHWLDVARYSDSNGYEKDLPRDQWIWRDWVVNAFNKDMPYNQFLIEQIAGDLLPKRGKSQLIATGFLRNGMTNEEGAIVPEQFRMEGMFDRMDAIGTGILGLSLKCAQCHTHKFDPISQTEYYQMFAFLNNTYEAQSWVYDAAQEKKIVQIRRGIAAVEERLKKEHPDWPQRMEAWENAERAGLAKIKWDALDAVDLHSSTGLNHPTKLTDKSILNLGHRSVSGDVYMIAKPTVTNVTGIRLEVLRYGDLPFGGPGRSFKGTWALTDLIVEAKKPGSEKWERVKLSNASADFAEPATKMEPEWENKTDAEHKRTRGPAAFLADGDALTAWRADRGPGRRNTDDVAVAQFNPPLTFPPDTQLKVALLTNHGGDDNGSKTTQIGHFRVSLTTSPNPKVDATPYSAVQLLRVPAAKRSPQMQGEIFAAWRAAVPEFKAYNDEIEALWKQYPEAMTSVLHLAERRPRDARDTHRLDRGGWDKPLESVKPGVMSALQPLPKDAPLNRLTFARWLADEKSPLTARVAVNRVWQAIFGTGLQETEEDFGTRAPEPSHPELLDWLAVDFMEHGWSHKYLIRAIVTSAAYQQDSRVTPALLEKDPKNRLLARGPRFRVEAEVLRDSALSMAGLLTSRGGGPSIFPPVPQSVIEYNYVKPTYWIPPDGPERYCRSLYLFRKRSMPDPALSTFDAPNGDFTCPRRMHSNSPLAALTAMNETMYVEASRALALRVLREGGPTDATRTDFAFRLCTGRDARSAERAELLKLLASRRQHIADGWLSPRELTTGDAEKLPALPPNTTPQDAAAWTIAARVLLNLDATLTKS